MQLEMGSATVPVAPVGVPPTGQQWRMVLPNGDRSGTSVRRDAEHNNRDGRAPHFNRIGACVAYLERKNETMWVIDKAIRPCVLSHSPFAQAGWKHCPTNKKSRPKSAFGTVLVFWWITSRLWPWQRVS